MARHTGPILIDTNVMIECWRVGAWKALAGGYKVETVETCLIETQTGFQNRRPEQHIDGDVLKRTIAQIHLVTQEQLAQAVTLDLVIGSMDPGERDLWAHAISRSDAWVLCGPDKASLRIAIRLGLRDKMVSLERLLNEAGYRPRIDFGTAYTQRWQEKTLAELAQRESK